MEIKSETINVYDQKCFGCKRHEKDVMVSVGEGRKIHDIFMSNEQAQELIVKLQTIVARNKEISSDNIPL